MFHSRPLSAAFLPVRSNDGRVAVMNRLMLRNQRRIATAALLLASFLEICGCSPVRTCEQLRLTRISAIPWDVLVQQCAQCLSNHDLSALKQVAHSSAEANSPFAVTASNQVVEEALREFHGPSFGSEEDASTRTESVRYTAATGSATTSGSQPIAWPIPESVLFVYDQAPVEGKVGRRIGTGFILTVPDRRHHQLDSYLVTARHVVDPVWASCGAKNPGSITVRFNRRAGGIGFETIMLQGRQSYPVITSQDNLTDLALIPLSRNTVPDLGNYRLIETSFEALPTRLELSSVRHDQRIVTAGISMPRMIGMSEFPVSDSGVISTTAGDTPIDVRCRADSLSRPTQLWTIAASVPAGVSGAPVYAELARGPQGESSPVLVGIQSAIWPGRGMAGITPVAALTDLVQDKLRREKVAASIRHEHKSD
jgi:hypothetical protein